MTQILIVKTREGKVVSVGVPAPKFAKSISLRPPEGGSVEAVDSPFKSKPGKRHLDVEVVKELLETGTLGENKRPAGRRR
jgi:hypothetical protein